MEQLLKPERFDVDPANVGAEVKWKHWRTTFANFLEGISSPPDTEGKKLSLLCNFISANVYQYINEAKTYEDAMDTLNSIYIIKRSEIYSRHCLASRTQQTGESVSEFLQVLKQMSKDCEFKSVTAEKYREEYIRDAFIRGLKCSRIRERLLENTTVTLDKAFDQARALELAELHSASYTFTSESVHVASLERTEDVATENSTLAAVRTRIAKCYFCGNARHPRNLCPARDVLCRNCQKKGHYQKVCKSTPMDSHSTASTNVLASASSSCLKKSMTKVEINGVELDALIDTGSSLSFINRNYVNKCNIPIKPYYGRITMADSSTCSEIQNCCRVTMRLGNHIYENVEVLIMNNLCADFLVGHDLLNNHSSLEIDFNGTKPPLKICSLAVAKITPVSLFSNLTPDCRPISTRSRRQTQEDKQFIKEESKRLLEEGIIEPSISPWRAQAFIVRGEVRKPRMVIDYSQTINRFTDLDAYPLPRIEDLIARVSTYSIFSTIDLKSAYHQLPLEPSEKQYTAFEADGKLYQFTRVPFGVTNGVACFQRVIDKIINDEMLEGVFPYLDDVTVCGKNQNEHDENLDRFLKAIQKYDLTLNEEKCRFSEQSVKLLGYVVGNKTLKPDPNRLKPLMDLPIPNDTASLQRCMGMFAHHCKWIPAFSHKIRPLLDSKQFPLTQPAIQTIETIKSDISKATLSAIEEGTPFRVETDASEHSIAATLSQAGRPVAFFSRTLNKSELKHSSIEKEAYAIVESLRYWRHFLIGKHFEVYTDQRSVAFMFDQKHNSKIKNEKIMRWRLDLACYKFDVVYRPGKQNASADAFSRISAVVNSETNLSDLHSMLCHPGVTRMYHWVRQKNLTYSLEEIKRVTSTCSICNELKPRFYKNEGTLIKATSPFERLNLDFKGPLPSVSRNRYLLTIVDEFSRFPFAIPCPDISATTVISCLQSLFSLFGLPAYVHSDRGASFMSSDLKNFLHSQGVATSRTTAYNPQGNGQVERYNGIIWKTIQLALKTKQIKIERWEEMLPTALHSIRSLLCTATNITPHERLFSYSRRSSNGRSLPDWLTKPGPVLLRNHVRENKYQPLVKEVHLLEANPDYAFIRLPDGRENTVSLRHLAPLHSEPSLPDNQDHDYDTSALPEPTRATENINDGPTIEQLEPTKRLSPRQRRPPSYLSDYITKF